MVWGAADVAQLGRPVGGAHDQRHLGLVGLDHRRRGARRRPCRSCTAPPPADPSPGRDRGPGTPPSARRGGRGAASRGSAASASASGVEREPGADDRVGHAGAHPLVHQRGAEGRRRCSPAYLGLVRLHAERLGAGGRASSWCTASPRPGARGRPSPPTWHATTRWCGRRARPRWLAPARADLPSGAHALGEAGGDAVYVGYSMGGRLACSLPSTSPNGRAAWCCWAPPRASSTPANGPPAAPPTRRSPPTSSATASTPSWSGGSPSPCSPGCPRTPPAWTTADATPSAGLAASLRLAGTGCPGRPVGPPRAARRAGAGAGRRARREVQRHRAATWPRPSASNARFEAVADAGHAAHLERPEAFLRVLRRWLTEQGW